VRCICRVAHVDKLMGIQNKQLSALDIVMRPPGSIRETKVNRRILIQADESAMENAFPLERQFCLSRILRRDGLGRTSQNPPQSEQRRHEPGASECVIADGQSDAKGDETKPPIEKNCDVFDGGNSLQGNDGLHAWFGFIGPETDRPTADRQDAEGGYHLLVSPSGGPHRSRKNNELAESFGFAVIPERLHRSAGEVFSSARRVREHIEHASNGRALILIGIGQLPAFGWVSRLTDPCLKLEKADSSSFPMLTRSR
jgi:hypothetical protein